MTLICFGNLCTIYKHICKFTFKVFYVLPKYPHFNRTYFLGGLNISFCNASTDETPFYYITILEICVISLKFNLTAKQFARITCAKICRTWGEPKHALIKKDESPFMKKQYPRKTIPNTFSLNHLKIITKYIKKKLVSVHAKDLDTSIACKYKGPKIALLL